jgi:4-amino-4-deoxychorismate lyase
VIEIFIITPPHHHHHHLLLVCIIRTRNALTNASTTSIMVKFYESSFTYDYSFSAVTLAYFLRYPNPYSTHVLSTDVISRSIDSLTGQLHTLRIHRKSSRLPPAVLKLLPKSVLGNVSGGRSESYILESSTIDVKEGWMKTESKNLDWTGILSVVEKQQYQRQVPLDEGDDFSVGAGTTGVVTTVMFRSRLGDRLRARARKGEILAADADDEPKRGFLASWSTSGIQRSIEAIASRKTENQLGKSKEGMMVVLERMRRGGIVGVLDGMRRDRELVLGHEGIFKQD